MSYYIHENNQQFGPFTIDQLKKRGITGETPVWRKGMSQWTKAKNVPELIDIISVTPPYTPQPPYTPYATPHPSTPCPDNHMALAVVATIASVFLCFPICLGVVSLIYACNVENKWRRGELEKARSNANNAKTWAIWSLVLVGVAILAYIIICFVAGAFYISFIEALLNHCYY